MGSGFWWRDGGTGEFTLRESCGKVELEWSIWNSKMLYLEGWSPFPVSLSPSSVATVMSIFLADLLLLLTLPGCNSLGEATLESVMVRFILFLFFKSTPFLTISQILRKALLYLFMVEPDSLSNLLPFSDSFSSATPSFTKSLKGFTDDR